jgi:hypothetical protein
MASNIPDYPATSIHIARLVREKVKSAPRQSACGTGPGFFFIFNKPEIAIRSYFVAVKCPKLKHLNITKHYEGLGRRRCYSPSFSDSRCFLLTVSSAQVLAVLIIYCFVTLILINRER